MKIVAIKTEYITLGQFLKLADCIQTGGQAKSFLQDESIWVNETVENRRGKKLKNQDIIEIKGFGKFIVVQQ